MQAYEAQRQQRESQLLKVLHEAISRPPQTVARDADDFHDAAEVENNLKWKQVASRIDDIARLWIPAAFAVALGVICRGILTIVTILAFDCMELN